MIQKTIAAYLAAFATSSPGDELNPPFHELDRWAWPAGSENAFEIGTGRPRALSSIFEEHLMNRAANLRHAAWTTGAPRGYRFDWRWAIHPATWSTLCVFRVEPGKLMAGDSLTLLGWPVMLFGELAISELRLSFDLVKR